jgi:shikimate dehydrogenase
MTPGVPYAEVIGDPVAHSKSPLIHRFWLEKLGFEGDYRATCVNQAELGAYFEQRRSDPLWRGCNITMPLKGAALAFVDERQDGGVGAVNCVVPRAQGLIGFNTDVDGVRQALQEGASRQQPCADEVATLVSLLGTGGAARAALAALRGMEVTVFGRDEAKARALSEELGWGEGFHDDLAVLAHADGGNHAEAQRYDRIVINATSLGMKGQPPLAIRLGAFPANTIVIDMVYDPLDTPLLQEARRLGMIAVDGLTMLVGQAARAFELFFGVAPPHEYDAELRGLLAP